MTMLSTKCGLVPVREMLRVMGAALMYTLDGIGTEK